MQVEGVSTMRRRPQHRTLRVLAVAAPGITVAVAVLTVTIGPNTAAGFVLGVAAGVMVSSALFLALGALALTTMNADLREANTRISGMSDELREAYQETLQALAGALDVRDTEVHGHSVRVVQVSLAIAEQLGIEPETDTWRALKYGALLHDVGKIGVPDAVLQKAGALTADEWKIMQQHAVSGYRMLQQVRFLRDGPAEVAFCHHERYDGSGYPRGLAGEEIPLSARIFAVADAFDVMTASRPYRKHLTAKGACREIRRCAATQFDPQIVGAFLSLRVWETAETKPSIAKAA